MDPSSQVELICDDSLQSWQVIGSGGFGQVYRARHKDWADVAIKILLHRGDGTMEETLLQEANLMNKASSPCVVRVYGIYQGSPPRMGPCMGIVMELMERGSLQSLQKALTGPPPWPLAFRLAKQVALGMNFLHTRKPPLLHQDLKPSNVLLDDGFNAKLTDFGLSRISTSVFGSSRNGKGEEGGTCSYMPPEALDTSSYKPRRPYDIYSYGILLWSIATGEEPYSGVKHSVVALRIPRGDRPDIKKIDQGKADGLRELIDLMERCWVKEPSQRPLFQISGGNHFGAASAAVVMPHATGATISNIPVLECFEDTERLFLRHKEGIHEAIHQVLSILQPSSTRVPSRFPTPPPAAQSEDAVDSSKQDPVTVELSDTDKEKFVDDHRSDLIQNMSMVMAIVDSLGKYVHSEAYSTIEAKEKKEDKIRSLYRLTLLPGGSKVKVAFYNALREHQPELLERLGG